MRGPRWLSGRSVFGVPGQQFPNDGVLLGAGKRRDKGVTGALCGLAQDRIGVAVHGAYRFRGSPPGKGRWCATAAAPSSALRARMPIRPEPVSSRTTGSVPAPM